MIYNNDQIKKIIPHRYPFLLVDTIEEIVGDKIIGKKCVSANEMHFVGHFPQKQVMPGVLILESLAQTGAVQLLSKPEYAGKIALFVGINKARFKRQVVPGDVLKLEVELVRVKMGIGFANAKASVDGEIACEAELMFAIDSTSEAK